MVLVLKLVVAALIVYYLAWLGFMAVRNSDDLGALKEELDDQQDHVAMYHTGHCDICRVRRERLGGARAALRH
jgi:threonine/homoserine/homoserine lactone efflux protein